MATSSTRRTKGTSAAAKPATAPRRARKSPVEDPVAPAPVEVGAKKRAAKKRTAKKPATGAPRAAKRATRAATPSGAGKSLVIVESPTKSRTLNKFLGRGFMVMASNGHIMDLPKSKLGVDIENDFEPQYEPIKGKNQ